ncbi:MAG: diacylglycerol kinase catalytic domain-containing protein [Armatimonadota bacterium]
MGNVDRLTENKIILVVRQTRLDELITRFNTLDQARFYVEHLGADFSDYLNEHRIYKQAVEYAESCLSRLGRIQTISRSFLPVFVFGPEDIVVVLGQDGLVANTAKYLSSQVIVGVTPDPKPWDGILLPFIVTDLNKVIPEVFDRSRPIREVTMAKAALNNGQQLYAVNDLFIGPKSHTSARYTIVAGDMQEQHSSSGIIVSTGLGSTGWLTSIITGAAGISNQILHQNTPTNELTRIPWDAEYLYYSVREPFPSRTSSAKLIFGRVTKDQPLFITSQMPENGVIFSDGVESDFLEFNSGIEAEIGIAEKRTHLVV